MAKNSNLHKAKSAKQDEFYTQLTDIEKEMVYYKDYFRGKTIYCNCDDARESNFFKYFSLNFEHLGLKKLITTGYKAEGKGVVLIYEGDKNGNRRVDDCEIEVKELQGNGDFRSSECIEYLKEADIVITNPPFSLFREYVAQLMEYNKKFIIIGNMNAITYKEIFPLIKNNQLWAGHKSFGGGMNFIQPARVFDASKTKSYKINDKGEYIKNIMGCIWFTNIEHKQRFEDIDLYKKYNEQDYPKYDNYNAIEVGKVDEIPMDYNGIMGVPITFIGKYNPTQFEIVGFFNNYKPETAGDGQIYGTPVKVATTKSLFRGPVVNGKATYFRILIKKVSA